MNLLLQGGDLCVGLCNRAVHLSLLLNYASILRLHYRLLLGLFQFALLKLLDRCRARLFIKNVHVARLQEVLQSLVKRLGQDLIHALDRVGVDLVDLLLSFRYELALEKRERLIDLYSGAYMKLCLEHLQSTHRVLLLLDCRVDRLSHFVHEINRETICKHEITALVGHVRENFIGTD